MPAFDIEALRTFVRVCELRSLTAAARHLEMTQAAVSQRITKLEIQSKARLIDRDFRPVKLTPSGRALFLRARGIMADIDRMQVEHTQRLKLPVDTLRLGVVDSLGALFLPHLVPQIRDAADQLLIRVDSSASLCQGLLQRELDLIVSTDHLPDRDDLERYVMLKEPIVLVHRRAEPVKGEGAYAMLKWLAGNRPFVRYSPVSPLARQIEAHLRRVGIDPPRTLEFNSSEAIVEMVKHGLGWTITTPVNLLQSRVSLKGLSVHNLPRGDMHRVIWLIARRGEFGVLPSRLATLSRRIIVRTIARRTARELPWLQPSVQVGRVRGSDR